MGAWRLEVSPATPATNDLFLHVIHVGPRQMPAMINTRLLSEAGRVGVEFDYQGATWSVLFDQQGDLGGELRMVREADARVMPLSNAVQLQ